MERIKDQTDVGVIVARFQVDQLTDGHLDLIETVVQENEKVIIFLGLSPLKATRNNPLDFEARKQMILNIYPDINVLYIKDCPSDKLWSKTLDNQIADLVGPESDVALYGSRDAFIKHYTGKYQTIELQQEIFVSGTAIRKQIGQKVKATEDFRAGVIWTTRNQFVNPKGTVDIALFNDDYTRLLLGRKPHDEKYRFVGGFIDCNETAEMAAAREVREETHLEIGGAEGVSYIGSFVINDWRYRAEAENILTLFYYAHVIFGRPEPDDDLSELKWIELKKLPYENVESWKKRLLNNFNPNHQILFNALFDKHIVNVPILQKETIEDIDNEDTK
jgi:bifunctional NMN adenylyltransferase/nudix hydrolase